MAGYDKLAPLYAQVRQRLAQRIAEGSLAEGEFLPAEPDLCAEMGVSRITLRRAVSELCDEGLLIRQRGRGTVVAPRKLRQTLVSLTGFTEAFGQDHRVAHAVLSAERGISDPVAGAALGAGTEARLARILRLVVVDGGPLTIETLFLDEARLPGVVGPVAAGASLFGALRETGGLEPAAAERIFAVGFATTEERRHLAIGPSQPVYRIDKTLLDAAGRRLSWSRLVTPTHLITYSLRS